MENKDSEGNIDKVFDSENNSHDNETKNDVTPDVINNSELDNNQSSEDTLSNVENKDIEAKKKTSIGKEIFEWVMVVVVALIISMLIKAFIFSTYKVNMVSMEDTLHEGHNVIVYKTGYFFNEPEHGDIIVFMHEEGKIKSFIKYLPIKNPGEVDYIKRVIGLPGDQIDIRKGYVYRKSVGDKDFVKLEEPYTKTTTDSKGMQLPFTVPEDQLFVMGDNREKSLDSRQIGTIEMDTVIGKAVLRIWPFSEFGGLYGK